MNDVSFAPYAIRSFHIDRQPWVQTGEQEDHGFPGQTRHLLKAFCHDVDAQSRKHDMPADPRQPGNPDAAAGW
jgi:hypothetical protein